MFPLFPHLVFFLAAWGFVYILRRLYEKQAFDATEQSNSFFSKERQSPNTADHKEQRKREKQRIEKEKKEQKEKDKKENEMKKKFKVSLL